MQFYKLLFGWIANIIVLCYKIPQIYHLYKVYDTTGLSLYSFCIQSVSYTLYIIHGFINEDTAIAYGMILPLIQNIIIILMYIYINKTKNKDINVEKV